jgi:hypothetical protein
MRVNSDNQRRGQQAELFDNFVDRCFVIVRRRHYSLVMAAIFIKANR